MVHADKPHAVIAGFPLPLAIYPLKKGTQARDISPSKNPAGSMYKVKSAPGPYGRPGGSTQFQGSRSSFIRFPNNGKLDARSSLTIVAWVYPVGRGPIFEYYGGVKFWVLRPDTLFSRYVRRTGKYSRALRRRKLKPGRWHYVGTTYDARKGVASLWLDSKPIASRHIGKMRLATKKAAYMGTGFRGRIACLQVYGAALTGPQMSKVKHLCGKPGESQVTYRTYSNKRRGAY